MPRTLNRLAVDAMVREPMAVDASPQASKHTIHDDRGFLLALCLFNQLAGLAMGIVLGAVLWP